MSAAKDLRGAGSSIAIFRCRLGGRHLHRHFRVMFFVEAYARSLPCNKSVLTNWSERNSSCRGARRTCRKRWPMRQRGSSAITFQGSEGSIFENQDGGRRIEREQRTENGEQCSTHSCDFPAENGGALVSPFFTLTGLNRMAQNLALLAFFLFLQVPTALDAALAANRPFVVMNMPVPAAIVAKRAAAEAPMAANPGKPAVTPNMPAAPIT